MRRQERRSSSSRHSLDPRFRDLRCLVKSPSARTRGIRSLETEPLGLQRLHLHLLQVAHVSECHSRLFPRKSRLLLLLLLLPEVKGQRPRPSHSAMEDQGGTGGLTDCNRDRPSSLIFLGNRERVGMSAKETDRHLRAMLTKRRDACAR